VPTYVATRDQIGFPSIGIQSIVPTTGASRHVTKRQPDKDRSTDNARTKSDQDLMFATSYWQFARAVISTTGDCGRHR
jgi:hypothetical protein